MKKLIFSLVAIMSLGANIMAQDVDAILDTYFEAIGGKEKLEQMESFQMVGKASFQGMEAPMDMTFLPDGRHLITMNFQGSEIIQSAYDGETLWGINMMTSEKEKRDDETLKNFKNGEMHDYPDPFLNYEEKGFTVEYAGEEDIMGTTCHKIKLIRPDLIVAGEEKPNFGYYFFDKDSGLMVAQEKEQNMGPMGTMMVQSVMSEFDEINGIVFPLSIAQYVEGSKMSEFSVEEIVVNGDVDEEAFKF